MCRAGFVSQARHIQSGRARLEHFRFWQKVIGERSRKLFHLRTNLRSGTVFLRHCLDIGRGRCEDAFLRYNGSFHKKDPGYHKKVRTA